MAARPNVEYIIRAKDESSKTLKSVVAGLNEVRTHTEALQKGLADGGDAARKTARGFRELEFSAQVVSKFSGTFNKLEASTKHLSNLREEMSQTRKRARELAEAFAKSAAPVSKTYARQQSDFTAKIDKKTQEVKTLQQELDQLTSKAESAIQADPKIESARDKAIEKEVKLKEAYKEQRAALDKLVEAERERLSKAVTGKTKTRDNAGERHEKQLKKVLKLTEAYDKSSDKTEEATKKLAEQRAELTKLSQAYGKAETGLAETTKAYEDFEKDVSSSDRVKKRQQSIEKLKGSWGEATKAVAAHEKKLKELQISPKLLKDIERQAISVDKAKSKLSQYAEAYEELNKKIKVQQAEGDPTLAKELAAAEQQVAKADRALIREQETIKKYRAELKRAGFDVKDYGQAKKEQKRLTQELIQAEEALAASTSKSSAAFNGFGSVLRAISGDTRRALSVTQRLRGQVLSLVSAYVGFYGVANEVKRVFQTATEFEAAESRFQIFFEGDLEAAAEEMKFVQDTARELKLDILRLADGYSQLVVSTDPAKFNLAETRLIFTSIATAARAAKVPAENIENALRAITQIMSKGTVASEELKGQLAEALGGATQDYAKGLGISIEELFEKMEKGDLSAKSLINLALFLEEKYGVAVPEALDGADAALQDFNTTLALIRKSVADSGFLEVLVDALNHLNEALQRPETREGLVRLAEAIGNVIKLIPKALDNIDKLIVAFKLLLAYAGVKYISRFLLDMAAGFKRVNAGIGLVLGSKGLAKLGALLARLVPVLARLAGPAGLLAGAAFGIYKLYKALGHQKQIHQSYSDSQASADKAHVAAMDSRIKVMEDAIATLERQRKSLERVAAGSSGSAKQQAEAALAALDAKQARIRQDLAELRGASTPAASTPDKGRDLGQIRPIDLSAVQPLSKSEVEELEKALLKITAAADKLDAQSFSQKLQLIQQRYQSFIERLKSINTEGDPELAKKVKEDLELVNSVIEAEKSKLKAEQGIEFARKRAQLQGQQEQIMAKLRQVQIESMNLSTDAGMTEAIRLTKESIEQQYSTLIESFRALGMESAVAYTEELQRVLIAQGEKELRADAKAEQEEKLQAAMEPVNRLYDLREATIRRIQAQLEAGQISQAQAQEQLNQLFDEVNPKIQRAVDNAIVLAEKLGDPQMVENLRAIKAELAHSNDEFKKFLPTAEQLNTKLSVGLVDTFEQFVSGAKSAGQAFDEFAKSFLKDIARMIAQQRVFDLLTGGKARGGVGGFIGSAIRHTGGLADGSGQRRNVPAYVFSNAPLYHTGGIAGLKADEVPIIAQRGEEVLTRNDPRHRFNGGAQPQQAAPPVELRISENALGMTLRDWFESELANIAATR